MGLATIEHLLYRPQAGREGEVELHRVQDLLRRAGTALFTRPHRMDFHQLLIMERGRAQHVVDFTRHRLSSGSVLWVRPGQVQLWGDLTRFDGSVLIFPSGTLDRSTDQLVSADAPEGPHHWSPEEVDVALLAEHCAGLRRLATLETPLRGAALEHALAVMLLQLTAWHQREVSFADLPEPFRDFRALVEQRFNAWHDVGRYCRALGWSHRSISRATRQARGMTPKQVIDERLLLEARRLLVQTDQPVHRIGTQLGFQDPSNFTAWFRRRDGSTPGIFRVT